MKKSHNPLNDFPKEEVRSAIQAGIAQAEVQINSKIDDSQKSKIKSGKRKVLYALSSVAAVFGILVGSSYYSPALASSLSQIPIIGSVFGDSNLIGLQQAQEKGLTSEIGETQTINGISVTLDEILYDQNSITVGLKMESEKELGEFYFGAGMDFTVNGEVPRVSSGGYGEDIQSSTKRTAIQDITVTEDMPNSFELGLTLHGENGETWYFSTPIKQIKDIKKVHIQHSEKVDGIKLTVTELSSSESGTTISYESSEEGTDFERTRAGYIEFLVVDQDGNEIMSHSGSVTGETTKNGIVFKSNKKFDPIDSSVSELTITPYLALPTGGGGVGIDENGGKKELGFNKDSLKPVEFDPFTLKIPESK